MLLDPSDVGFVHNTWGELFLKSFSANYSPVIMCMCSVNEKREFKCFPFLLSPRKLYKSQSEYHYMRLNFWKIYLLYSFTLNFPLCRKSAEGREYRTVQTLKLDWHHVCEKKGQETCKDMALML